MSSISFLTVVFSLFLLAVGVGAPRARLQRLELFAKSTTRRFGALVQRQEEEHKAVARWSEDRDEMRAQVNRLQVELGRLRALVEPGAPTPVHLTSIPESQVAACMVPGCSELVGKGELVCAAHNAKRDEGLV